MPRRFSVAEVRDHLPRLVHEVEGGEAVEITRRGEAVAVLIDMATWRGMKLQQHDPFAALQGYWGGLAADAEDLDPAQIFDGCRDRAPAPAVELE